MHRSRSLAELIAYGKSKTGWADLRLSRRPLTAAPCRRALFRDAGVKGLNIPFRGDADSYTKLSPAASMPR